MRGSYKKKGGGQQIHHQNFLILTTIIGDTKQSNGKSIRLTSPHLGQIKVAIAPVVDALLALAQEAAHHGHWLRLGHHSVRPVHLDHRALPRAAERQIAHELGG